MCNHNINMDACTTPPTKKKLSTVVSTMHERVNSPTNPQHPFSRIQSLLQQQSALSFSNRSLWLRAIDKKTLTHTFRPSALGLMVVLGAEWGLTNGHHTPHWCHTYHRSQCTFPPSPLSKGKVTTVHLDEKSQEAQCRLEWPVHHIGHCRHVAP